MGNLLDCPRDSLPKVAAKLSHLAEMKPANIGNCGRGSNDSARGSNISPGLDGRSIIIKQVKDNLEKFRPKVAYDERRLDDPNYVFSLFPVQKSELESLFLSPAYREDRSTSAQLKKALTDNVNPKANIIHAFLNSKVFFGHEADLIPGLMTAVSGSGNAVKLKVIEAVDEIYGRSENPQRNLIIALLSDRLSSENPKVSHEALNLLTKYKVKVPPPEVLQKLMTPYTSPEIDAWNLSEPKGYDSKQFKFLIHGVLTDASRPAGSNLGKFFSKSAFEDPKGFMERKRICATLIGIDEEAAIHEVRTFAPTGFILRVPRANITHASPENFASNGRYVSRKTRLMSPQEILQKTSGKYNEILVEGTNRLSGEKSEIIGVFIKEDTPDSHKKEAVDFARVHKLPIVFLPGRWSNNFAPPKK